PQSAHLRGGRAPVLPAKYTRRGRPACPQHMLDRFAGVRRRDACGRLVDRRQAHDCRFAMNLDAQNKQPVATASDAESSRAGGSALPYFFCVVVALAMAYGGWKWWQVWQFERDRSQAITTNAIGPPLKEFELTERSGKPFRSADMKGRVWVAMFFFTSCPGQC